MSEILRDNSKSEFSLPDEVIDLIEAIPERMCGGQQPMFLYQLSLATEGRGAIVEIGTCAGKSTIALAYAQRQKNGVPVNTIDINEHSQFLSNLGKASVQAFVNQIVNSSKDVAESWCEPIELLWIDADHRYTGVYTDIKSWSEFVVVGGRMAFHDYPGAKGTLGGVGKAVHELVLSRPDIWRLVADREAGSIIVFEKLRKEVDPKMSYDDVERIRTLWERITGKITRVLHRPINDDKQARTSKA